MAVKDEPKEGEEEEDDIDEATQLAVEAEKERAEKKERATFQNLPIRTAAQSKRVWQASSQKKVRQWCQTHHDIHGWGAETKLQYEGLPAIVCGGCWNRCEHVAPNTMAIWKRAFHEFEQAKYH